MQEKVKTNNRCRIDDAKETCAAITIHHHHRSAIRTMRKRHIHRHSSGCYPLSSRQFNRVLPNVKTRSLTSFTAHNSAHAIRTYQQFEMFCIRLNNFALVFTRSLLLNINCVTTTDFLFVKWVHTLDMIKCYLCIGKFNMHKKGIHVDKIRLYASDFLNWLVCWHKLTGYSLFYARKLITIVDDDGWMDWWMDAYINFLLLTISILLWHTFHGI